MMKSTLVSSLIAFCTACVTFHSILSPELEEPRYAVESRDIFSVPLAPAVDHEFTPSYFAQVALDSSQSCWLDSQIPTVGELYGVAANCME